MYLPLVLLVLVLLVLLVLLLLLVLFLVLLLLLVLLVLLLLVLLVLLLVLLVLLLLLVLVLVLVLVLLVFLVLLVLLLQATVAKQSCRWFCFLADPQGNNATGFVQPSAVPAEWCGPTLDLRPRHRSRVATVLPPRSVAGMTWARVPGLSNNAGR